MLGLVLIEERQRATPGPAAQQDLLVAEALSQVRQAGAQVEQTFLEDERRVIPAVAWIAIDDVQAGARERRHERKEGAAPDRMGEYDHRLRVAIGRADAHALDEDGARIAPVDVLDRTRIDVNETIGLP